MTPQSERNHRPISSEVVQQAEHGWARRWRERLISNWCRRRSHLLYFIISHVTNADVKINIAMRCRNEVDKDWGHAWVTVNGRAFLESHTEVLQKERTKIAETEKYIYWIFN